MARPQIPHFSIPFRYRNGKPVVVEQDSIDDIANCVEAALRTPLGARDEYPEYGVPEMVFRQQPINTSDIVRRLDDMEPRASILAEEAPDRLDASIARVRMTLRREE